jgi:DNA invertase Pin-like site-specific DNA recombinase
MRVVGYVRVSTDEQANSGAGLEAQRRAIVAECERRGWHLVQVIEDAGFSAKSMKRPGVQKALSVLKTGDANALVVGKLDRLSRSMLDFTGVMAKAQKEGWALVALDCAVDTTTPSGEAMANMLATFAQFERRLISQRTKDALAVMKARGEHLGRPPSIPAGVVKRIKRQRARGDSLRKIADDLNSAGIPTAQGGVRWHASTVSYTLKRTSSPVRTKRAKAQEGVR